MKKILYVIIMTLCIYACQDEYVEKTPQVYSNSDHERNIRKIVSELTPGLFQNINTRASQNSNKTIATIDPVIHLEDTLFWITNYLDKKGYLILTTQKECFPIVAFSDTGSFNLNNLNETDQAWLNEQIWKAEYRKTNLNNESSNIYAEFWKFFFTTEEGEEISLEVVKDSTFISSTRGIPERKNPLNRQSVFPLCYPISWGTGFGYNYEMPYVDMPIWKYCKAPVHPLAVSVGHIMSKYWTPSKYGWMYMPSSIKQTAENDKPNLIASLFKDISTSLKAEYNWNGTKIAPSMFFTISLFLYNNGYTHPGTAIKYNNDESSFQSVYSSLLNYHPVLFVNIYQKNAKKPDWHIDNTTDKIESAYVIDGYQEVKVKMTKKKRFLGIKVKQKVWYIYADYFHYLIPLVGDFSTHNPSIVAGTSGGWYNQDYYPYDRNSSNYKKYAIINIAP